MSPDERRAWIRLLSVLAVAALLRTAWAARSGVGAPGGVERDLAAAADTVARLHAEEARRGAPLAADEKIDPNRADAVELDRLPGIGPSLAEAIVRTRGEAPFRSIEDLERVPGIGASTLARLTPHIRLPPTATRASPGSGAQQHGGRVDLSTGDVEALQRLPGVGAVLAERIVASRERDGPFRSVDDLIRVPGIGPATLERLRDRVRIR